MTLSTWRRTYLAILQWGNCVSWYSKGIRWTGYVWLYARPDSMESKKENGLSSMREAFCRVGKKKEVLQKMTTTLRETMDRVKGLMEHNGQEKPKKANTPTSTPSTSDRVALLDDVFGNAEVVPEEYSGARPRLVPELAEVRDGGEYGACFFGPPGTGKTYAATALAYQVLFGLPIYRRHAYEDRWVMDGLPLSWVEVPYLLVRIRDSYNRQGGQTERQIVDECVKAHVLLLDDLGAEKQTVFTGATLYSILSRRRNRRRYTIITTNQSLDQIDEWEPRIASRMSEMLHVKLPNRDRRLEKAKGMS